MSTDRVMLLIDADNVSIDVMEQAVALLLKQHGALHVRRAYCTAESALKHQTEFKRLGIKPMVNLAAGKNSTDIALAVDAIDLVLAERPDVVVIASSDSDFAPLVARLREKGCNVRGIGQLGKTADETQDVYDDYTVFEHRKTAEPTRTRAPARKAAAKKTPATKAPAKKATRGVSSATAAKTTAAKKAAAPAAKPAAPPAQPVTPPPAPPPPPPPAPPTMVEKARQILACLPELGRGQTVELRVASQRLREAQLLSKSGASTKLLGQFPELFELLPAGQPNNVRLRGA